MKQRTYVKAIDTGKAYMKICFLIQIYVKLSTNSIILGDIQVFFPLSGKIDVGFIAVFSRISLFKYIVFSKPSL